MDRQPLDLFWTESIVQATYWFQAMQYMQWNEKIARHFFNTRNAGQSVYLAVSRSLINQLGGGEVNFADFILSLKSGPSWATGTMPICDKALKASDRWRERKLEFPPTIGYLSLFVLAVEEESPEHGPLAYHNPLRKLLGEPAQVNKANPRFDRMIELWDDLEVWSRQDKNGELGFFRYNFATNHIHVGIPKEQFLASSLMQDRYRTCPRCHEIKSIDGEFGWRKINGKPVPQSWCYSCRSGSWKKSSDGGQQESSAIVEPVANRSIERTLGESLKLVPRLKFLPGEGVTVNLMARRADGMPDDVNLQLEDGSTYGLGRFHQSWYSGFEAGSLSEQLRNGVRASVEAEDGKTHDWKLSGRKVYVLQLASVR